MLTYVKGDATRPQGEGPKFIIHCCNNAGLWGAGFVLAISNRWPEPEDAYYALGKTCGGYNLGNTQAVKVEEDLWVINMIGQSGVGRRGEDSRPPIRYKAIRNALHDVAVMALNPKYRGPYKSVAIHAPKFGAGLAGGDWDTIEEIIKDELINNDIPVTIYEFDPRAR